MECQPSSPSAKGSSLEYISVGWDACLGEKRNCETLVEMVLVVESEVSYWVGGRVILLKTCIVTQSLLRMVDLVLVM